jgi:hypothetical protein
MKKVLLFIGVIVVLLILVSDSFCLTEWVEQQAGETRECFQWAFFLPVWFERLLLLALVGFGFHFLYRAYKLRRS